MIKPGSKTLISGDCNYHHAIVLIGLKHQFVFVLIFLQGQMYTWKEEGVVKQKYFHEIVFGLF